MGWAIECQSAVSPAVLEHGPRGRQAYSRYQKRLAASTQARLNPQGRFRDSQYAGEKPDQLFVRRAVHRRCRKPNPDTAIVPAGDLGTRGAGLYLDLEPNPAGDRGYRAWRGGHDREASMRSTAQWVKNNAKYATSGLRSITP